MGYNRWGEVNQADLKKWLFMCVCVLCCVLFLKGEAYKLFWPEKAEFVRMAARYGVTIIPFASVGEDELLEVLFLILKISFTAFFFPPLKT
jgi:1-acyl-sn-glycerol-3-phosphate acyltransferase